MSAGIVPDGAVPGLVRLWRDALRAVIAGSRPSFPARSRAAVPGYGAFCELSRIFVPNCVTYSKRELCSQNRGPAVMPVARVEGGALPHRGPWAGEGIPSTVRRLRRRSRILPLNSRAPHRIIVLVATAGAMHRLFQAGRASVPSRSQMRIIGRHRPRWPGPTRRFPPSLRRLRRHPSVPGYRVSAGCAPTRGVAPSRTEQ